MPPLLLPETLPKVGEPVTVWSGRWLVEEVMRSANPGETGRVKLFCADDDPRFAFKGGGARRFRLSGIENRADNHLLEKQGGRE